MMESERYKEQWPLTRFFTRVLRANAARLGNPSKINGNLRMARRLLMWLMSQRCTRCFPD